MIFKQRTYVSLLLAFFVYSFACVQIGLLVCAVCHGYYIRAWHSLMTQSKYRVYARLIREQNSYAVQDSCVVMSNDCPAQSISVIAPELVQAAIPEPVQHKKISTHKRRHTKTTYREKSTVIASRDSVFVWPLAPGSFWLSSLFGPRLRDDNSPGFHYGIDLAAQKGTLVRAPKRGIVKRAGYVRGYGNTIDLKHDARFQSRYAHLQEIYVRPGDIVAQGECIGTVGDTGSIRKMGKDGSHLHFELYYRGRRVNPMQFLPKLVC